MKASLLLIGAGGAAIGLGLYWAFGRGVTGPTPPGLAASLPFIGRLHPSIQGRAKETLQRAINIGIPLVVTSGYRDSAEQARLYAQGRTAPGEIVTNAPPGSSWHEFGLAFDVAPMGPNGQATWPEDNALWARIGAAGKAAGLEWGGDFTTMQPDRPHFDYHPGLTLSDARAGARPRVT